MSNFNFYFEYTSTYSAIAAIRIKDLYHSGKLSHINLNLKPFLLGLVFKNNGNTSGPLSNIPKAKYMMKDFTRVSVKQLGFALSIPKKFPLKSNLATQITTYLINSQPSNKETMGKLLNFIAAVYISGFQKHADISNVDVLKQCLNQIFPELDADQVISLGSNAEFKEKVKETTEEAINLGIFGAPSFIVKDQLFWGQDRLDEALQLCGEKQKAKL
ncbi:thioredoxin-like protein [Neoconidiobolus thromboides FSU 785]|nr:thioredoxin-like protein [Neoconidiobolus thromboides FSU 785]